MVIRRTKDNIEGQRMDYDLEMLNNNESSTSSSLSSSDTFLNFFKLPAPPIPIQQQQQALQPPPLAQHHHHITPRHQQYQLHQQPHTLVSMGGELAEANEQSESTQQTVDANSHPTGIPNSCSLIFSTAASFNINQQVTYITP